MPLLTFTGMVSRGVAKLMTLSKASLTAPIAAVTDDPYWIDTSHISRAVVYYEGTGGQSRRLTFDFTVNSPTANLFISEKGRDDWRVTKVQLFNFDGGSLTITEDVLQSEVPGGISGLNLSFGGGGSFPLNDDISGYYNALIFLEGHKTPSLNNSYTFNGMDYADGAVPFAVKSGVFYSQAVNDTTLSLSTDTVSTSFEVKIRFNVPVSDFVLSDIEVTNGTVVSLSGSGRTYYAIITPTSVGEVTVSVDAGVATNATYGQNLQSNVLTANYVHVTDFAAVPFERLSAVGDLDEVANTLDIVSDGLPFGVAGTGLIAATLDTTLSSSYSIVSSSFDVKVAFNSPVSDFVSSDLSVTNGTVTAFSGSGRIYYATVTPSSLGSVLVEVNAGVASNVWGSNLASSELSFTYVSNSDTLCALPFESIGLNSYSDLVSEALPAGLI